MIQLQQSSEQEEKKSQNKRFKAYLDKLNWMAPGRVWLAVNILYHGDDRRRLNILNQLASRIGLPLVATNDVHYHHPDRRPLQDVISCIREKCTLETAGFKLLQNADWTATLLQTYHPNPTAHSRQSSTTKPANGGS